MKQKCRRASLSARLSQPPLVHVRRRRASAPDAEAQKLLRSSINIAHRLFHLIHSTLLENCLDTRNFTLEHFGFLFPHQNHDEPTLTCFERWIEEPMFVSDKDLEKMIDLMPSNHASSLLQAEAAIYFRSYTMTCDELKMLLQYWSNEGYSIDKLKVWKDLIARKPPSTIITIRYIGKVAQRSNPYMRLMEDLRSKKSSYLGRQLHTALQSILPSVVQNY